MTLFREKLRTYSIQAAQYLRGHEANALRGQTDRLQELELVSDVELLKKHTWRIAIYATGGCFFIAPLVLGLLQRFLPLPLAHFLWIVVKLGMAVTCCIFGLAAYYTFGPSSETGTL